MHALARRFVAPPLARTGAAAVQLGQQCLRRDPGVGLNGMLDGHLVSQPRRIDIDLRNRGTRGDQLAALGRPVRQARAEGDDEVALADQLVGGRRGEPAADADRPRVFREQAVAAYRGR